MRKISLTIDLFKFLCVVTAGFMVGVWFYKYHKNEDISLIDYNTFKEAKDTLYPELSTIYRVEMCFHLTLPQNIPF